MSRREELNVGILTLGNKAVNLSNGPMVAVYTVGTKAGSVINVALQFQDVEGAACQVAGCLRYYLADDAAGLTPSTVAPSGGIAIGTNGALIESVANLSGMMITELAGTVDIDITEAGTKNYYLVCVLPNGQLAVSGVIAF